MLRLNLKDLGHALGSRLSVFAHLYRYCGEAGLVRCAPLQNEDERDFFVRLYACHVLIRAHGFVQWIWWLAVSDSVYANDRP